MLTEMLRQTARRENLTSHDWLSVEGVCLLFQRDAFSQSWTQVLFWESYTVAVNKYTPFIFASRDSLSHSDIDLILSFAMLTDIYGCS